MSLNSAAWLVSAKAKPLEVKPAPSYSPSAHEILVRNRAVAINPVDLLLQDTAFLPLSYPTILGGDVAGEVVQVGSEVTRFKAGDRVMGHAVGLMTRRPSDNAFQLYHIILDHNAAPLPASLKFEEAVVVPLAMSTATVGFYSSGSLELEHPSVSPKPTGKTLLVWGGSTSVGSNAIQLAVASGYEVITTASAKNFAYVKELGASEAFDYTSATIADDLVSAFEGKTIAGAFDAIGRGGSTEACVAVLEKSDGAKALSSVNQLPDTIPSSIRAKWIHAATIKDPALGKITYENFMPMALAEGAFKAAPQPLIAGHGLESLQDAMAVYAKGMSAQKVVVLLD